MFAASLRASFVLALASVCFRAAGFQHMPVDDELLIHQEDSALMLIGMDQPLNELGFQKVKATKDSIAMAAFILRLLDASGKTVAVENLHELDSFSQHIVRSDDVKNLLELKDVLRLSNWVTQKIKTLGARLVESVHTMQEKLYHLMRWHSEEAALNHDSGSSADVQIQKTMPPLTKKHDGHDASKPPQAQNSSHSSNNAQAQKKELPAATKSGGAQAHKKELPAAKKSDGHKDAQVHKVKPPVTKKGDEHAASKSTRAQKSSHAASDTQVHEKKQPVTKQSDGHDASKPRQAQKTASDAQVREKKQAVAKKSEGHHDFKPTHAQKSSHSWSDAQVHEKKLPAAKKSSAILPPKSGYFHNEMQASTAQKSGHSTSEKKSGHSTSETKAKPNPSDASGNGNAKTGTVGVGATPVKAQPKGFDVANVPQAKPVAADAGSASKAKSGSLGKIAEKSGAQSIAWQRVSLGLLLLLSCFHTMW